MKSALVSIITPTFNRYSLIGETLDSLLDQKFKNWECIVVDDGSLDYTPELLEFYVKKDHRIRYLKRPENYSKGANACRNYGFQKSSGEYIQWLDDDDLISKEKIEIQVRQLSKPENQDSVSMSSWKFIREDIEDENLQNDFENKLRISIKQYYDTITNGSTFVPQNAFLVPRNIVLKSGEWNTYLKINQDAEYFNRIFLNAKNILYEDHEKCYALYRYHESDRNSKRITNDYTKNLMFGYRLMFAYLSNSNITCSKYFKWKLSEIIKRNSHDKNFLNKSEYFFLENNISLKWYNLENVKFYLYKNFSSLKRRLKKNN